MTVRSQTQFTDNRTAHAVLFNTGCKSIGLCTDSAHVQSSHPSNQPTTLRLQTPQTSCNQAVNYDQADPLQGIMAPDLVLGHWAARTDVQYSHSHVDNEYHFHQTSPVNPWMTAGYQDLASLSATRAPCIGGDTTASSYSPPDAGRPGIADGQYWSPWNDKRESTHQIDQGGASADWGFF